MRANASGARSHQRGRAFRHLEIRGGGWASATQETNEPAPNSGVCRPAKEGVVGVTMIVDERWPYGDRESQPKTKCRQHCSLDEKLRLVSLTYEAGALVRLVAGRPANANLPFTSRRQLSGAKHLMQEDAVGYAG